MSTQVQYDDRGESLTPGDSVIAMGLPGTFTGIENTPLGVRYLVFPDEDENCRGRYRSPRLYQPDTVRKVN